MINRSLAGLAAGLILFSGCGMEEEPPRPMTRREAYERRKAADAAKTPPPAAPAKAACPERPNILIVSLDTLRFDATSLGANATNRTPALEQLAATGVNFTRSYSTHDSTPPSHASLFTGYVNALGNPALDRPEASIAHQLRRVGYDTFAVVANGNLSPKSFATMKPFADNINLHDLWMEMTDAQKAKLSPPVDARMQRYAAEPNDWYRMVVWADADQVLQRFEKRLTRAKSPFLGFVNLLDSHEPYFPDPSHYTGTARERKMRAEPPPAPRFRTISAELANPELIADEQRREEIKTKIANANGRAWALTVDLDAAARKIYRMRYEAEVRELDRAVARLMAALDRAKLRDSTIVVLTSDHGESFGEAELLTHSFNDAGDLESTHRVPMLIVFPPCYGIAPAKIDELATIADVPPTLYELLGIDARKLWTRARPGEVGRSLLPLIRAHGAAATVAAAADDWKPIAPAEKSTMDEEALRRLKSLGYLQ